jgi:hypothetical protein
MEPEHLPPQITLHLVYRVAIVILVALVTVGCVATVISIPSPTSAARTTSVWTPVAPTHAFALYRLSANTRGWRDWPEAGMLTFLGLPYHHPNTDRYSCIFASVLQISFEPAAPFGTLVRMQVSEQRVGCPSLG